MNKSRMLIVFLRHIEPKTLIAILQFELTIVDLDSDLPGE